MENESIFAPVRRFLTPIFQPLLEPIFGPINSALAHIYQPWAAICAIGLFVLAMLWVGVVLRKEYVNLDAPRRGMLYDLRLWTVVSMLPHVIIYLYFRGGR